MFCLPITDLNLPHTHTFTLNLMIVVSEHVLVCKLHINTYIYIYFLTFINIFYNILCILVQLLVFKQSYVIIWGFVILFSIP